MCALHDYTCPVCGKMAFDVYRSVREGATFDPPTCATCGPDQIMDWLPAVGAMDTFDVNKAFDTFDGRNNPVRIDSLKKLRQVERESEVNARNGEGQQVNWRMYSNGRSNTHSNTLGEAVEAKPSEAGKKKFGKQILKSIEGQAPEVTFGPGVSEANCSALKEG